MKVYYEMENRTIEEQKKTIGRRSGRRFNAHNINYK